MAKEIEVVFIEEKKGFFKLGQRKAVKPGYALNYLLPYKWAVRNTPENKTKIDAIGKKAQKHQEELKVKAEALNKTLKKAEIVFTEKVHDDTKLYGSIKVTDIVTKLNKDYKVELDKYDIQLAAPIKEIGEYPISIIVHQDIPLSLTVQVLKEEEKKKKATSGKDKKTGTKDEDNKKSAEIKTYADDIEPSEEDKSKKASTDDIKASSDNLF